MFSRVNGPLIAGAALLATTIALAVALADFRMAGVVAMAGGAVMCTVGIIGTLVDNPQHAKTSRPTGRESSDRAVVAPNRRFANRTQGPRQPTTARDLRVRRRSLIPTH
jgi:hypothetical protein